MKVLSQLLGRYSKTQKPLILFRLPDTDTLLYRLSDIEPIFALPPLSYKKSTFKDCYRDNEDTYLNTQVLSEIAGQFNRHLLTELCKLKPNDYNVGLADAILQTLSGFKRAPKEENIWESVQLPLENLEDVIEREVKTEPSSPPSMSQALPAEARKSNAMALDKVLLGSSDPLSRRRKSRLFSIMDLEKPSKKQKTVSEQRPHSSSGVAASASGVKQPRKLHSFPPGVHGDNAAAAAAAAAAQQQQHDDPLMSTRKRLSIKPKNALNLTIFAPSYNEQLMGVRSAPINSNFFRSAQAQQLHHQQQQQQQQQQHLQQQQQQQQQQQHPQQHPQQQHPHFHPHPPHRHIVGSSLAPASATLARHPFTHQPSPRRHEFAIPPIVPSQQQPPHTAHPASRENMSYQQHYMASPSLYGSHPHSKPPPSKRTHDSQPQIAVTAASVPLPPKTPTTNSFAALQRQQYLQPFEHLFDTIETTRTLKSTLDDQIRRSSSLMQTLQASATTLEGLVRNQVKEAQWEMMTQLEQTMEGLVQRIEAIEGRLDHAHSNGTATSTASAKRQKLPEQQQQNQQASLPSPLPSASKEERAAAEDLVAFSERTRENRPSSSSLSEDLQTPPTIVRSQNDIGPQEYHNMLNTLRDRLDRLERQIET
ncbi:hypothetical protein [Parasitella parasitica]|uniref:Uncharacterized protein n=1 Tax=Parasitella parasitica TaxID=35722 RepID=A0A0B7N3P5_9FUNG|nr:hypothetical protein [Parasitella parasitica]